MLDADCCIFMVCWMLDAYLLYYHGLFRYPPLCASSRLLRPSVVLWSEGASLCFVL